MVGVTPAGRSASFDTCSSAVSVNSCITLLRSAGVADIAVQRLVGHVSLAMTDRYTHVDEQHRNDIPHALELAHRQAVSAMDSTDGETSA